jgi:hypothetical protein
MTRAAARISRIGLAIIGLILLLGGGAVLALGSSHAPLLTPAQVRYPTQNGWVWPAAALVSAVIALLALWWMAAQTSIRTVRRIPVEPDRVDGTSVLRASAATWAIIDELESHPGIRAADAALRGFPVTPDLRLLVAAENRTDPALVRTHIENEAVPHLRTALELDTLPTIVDIRFSRAFDRHFA